MRLLARLETETARIVITSPRQKEPESLPMPNHSPSDEPHTSGLSALELVGRTAGTFEPAILQEVISALRSREDPPRSAPSENREARVLTPLAREKTMQLVRVALQFARVWEEQTAAEASQNYDRRAAFLQSSEQARRRLSEKLASCLAGPFLDLVVLEEIDRKMPGPPTESVSD